MQKGNIENIHLLVLNPGHFHAALLQKSMYPQVDSQVHIYAPEGPELNAYLSLINKYNTSQENPTFWKQEVYTGSDFMERMLKERAGNVVVIAGNNRQKTESIKRSVDAGLNVLSDKPMAINSADFDLLLDAFDTAGEKNVLLYDIMTERFEITNILQKTFMQYPEVFGVLEKGTLDNPAVIKESVHHFFKDVSGVPLVRPAWFFDVEQEGNGIVDVTTHIVDLVQWECFPGVTFNYKSDINMLSAKRWATKLTLDQFKKATQVDAYPEYLKKDVKEGLLHVFANGEMNYTIKGVHAKVSVIWKFEAPEGSGDTHLSTIRGTKANVVIRQGKEQQFKPVLYIEAKRFSDQYQNDVEKALLQVQSKYPGVSLKKVNRGWEVVIPESYKVGHEAHFAEVTKNYLTYLKEGKLPDWEVPNMLAKYYTTTQALEKAITK